MTHENQPTGTENQHAGNLPEAISNELNRAIPEIQAYRSAAELTISLRALNIEGVDDREGYSAVDEARKNVRAERLELQRIGKATVDYLEAAKKLVRNQALEIVSVYQETETILKEKLQAIDDEKTRIKEAEERAALEAFNRRVEALFAAKFVYDGLNYNAGALIISPQDVAGMPDDVFHDAVKQGELNVSEIKERAAAKEAELAALRAELEKKAAWKKEIEERERAAFEADRERIYRETSKQAQSETDKAIQAEIDAKRAFQQRQQRTIEELEARGRADAATLVPGAQDCSRAVMRETDTPATSANPPGYDIGFQAAKNLVLQAFESGEKRTRGQWIEFIREMKP